MASDRYAAGTLVYAECHASPSTPGPLRTHTVGYLLFRFLVPGRPVTAETIQALVDEVLLPSLTTPPS